MDKSILFDSFISIFLILCYLDIEDSDNYIFIIYIFLFLYHVIIFIFLLIENLSHNIIKIKLFLIVSILIYLFSYYIIFDTNPFLLLIFYYLFFPFFWKSIFIVFIHTYSLSLFLTKENNYKLISNNSDYNENISFKIHIPLFFSQINKYYYLSGFFNIIFKNKKRFFIFLFCFILIIFLEFKLFIHRIKYWVYFNDKSKTLPKMSSSNTTFYITAAIANVESIIQNYINEMIKLINYLGKENIIISIVENNDSLDNTTYYLEQFKNYLDERKII